MAGLVSNIGRISRSIRRVGVLRTAAAGTREMLFPHGSARDRFWADHLRPVLRRATGRKPPPPLPPTTLTWWTSPANRLGLVAGVATILVVKVDHIGDFLLAMPAVSLLRRNFPSCRIDLLCASWNAELARRTGLFDAVFVHDFFAAKGDSQKRHRAGVAGIAALGLPRYDVAIDLRVDEDTRGLLGHVSAACKAGYHSQLMPADMAIVLPQVGARHPDGAGIVPHQRNLMLALVAAVVGCFDPLGDTQHMIARMVAAQEPAVAALRRGWRGPVIAVNTSSGREIKNWPIARFVEVCRWMAETLGATVVLLGGPDQAADAGLIAGAVAGSSLVNLVGQIPLDRSLAVVRQADLFLGNDSALTHAAAAMAVPTVAIFSGIDPIAMWGPLGPRVVALREPVSCSPCHLSYVTDCRHGRACIVRIEVDSVKQAVLDQLVPAAAAAQPVLA